MKNKKFTPFKFKLKLPNFSFLIKGIFVFLMLSYGSLSATNNYAQQTKLSINLTNTSLKKALSEIERKSEFYFMYNNSLIDTKQKVNVKAVESSIVDILNQLFKGTDISYELINKQIILYPKAIIKSTLNTPQENIKITGKVYDSNDESLPGVSIVEKGTQNGTLSDANGYFEIEVPSKNTVLVFSFLGFKTQEIAVEEASNPLLIKMIEFNMSIDEVIVVGYGVSSKKLLTGSVENINSEELQETASYSLEGALNGKASGIQILQNSGTPGSAIGIKIRGTASIYSGTQPLYVIDGVPMTTGNYSQIGFGGQGIDASMDINPNNIESITILKDASASAIYGARAANGVILITTKKGKAGKSAISFRSYYGFQKEWKRLDLMDATQWKEYVSTFNPSFVTNLTTNYNTNWQEEVFEVAPMSNNELSFSGGNDKTLFYISAGYLNQEGILIGTGYKKFSLQTNVEHKLNDKLSLSFRNSLTNSSNDRVRGDEEIDGVLPNAISLPPIYPVYDELGNYSENGYFSNPVATALESTTEALTVRNMSSLEFTYKIAEGLTLRNQWGLDYYNLHERRIEPTTTRLGAQSNGMIIEGRSNVSKTSQQLLLNYDKKIGDIHNFEFLLGYSFEIIKKRYSYIYATNFPSVYPEYINSAGNIEQAETDAIDEGIISYFGRVKYNLADKYLLEFSLRADGSSKFGSNNRYAMLPAVSVAWRVIEESFMANQRIFSDLKMKVGYGLTGNDQIGNNRYQNLYITGVNYNSLPGLAPKQIPNPDLKWETTSNFNYGIDLEFLKGKIGISAEYYYNLTTDLLLPRPLPGSSGFTTYMTNVGSIENKGYEFTVNTTNIDKELKWTSSFNISFNKNKVLELYNDQPIYSTSRGNNAIIAGQPLGVFYMYESKGVDPSTGDLVLTDFNNDNLINANDQFVVGDPNPLFTGGLTNSISYKGFDFRLFVQFSYGNDIYNGTRQYLENNAYGESDNQLATVLTQWRNVGDITQIPRFGGTYNNRKSTRYMEDGSYLRLKEATLGYNFPQALLDKLKGISNIKVYVKGQNLFTLTQYQGLDPEVNYDGQGFEFGMGTDFFTFPHPRVILFGANIDF